MDDRELLEMAARAAGIDMQHRAMFGGDAEPGYYKYPPGVPPLWTWWNPLTDDGDALRLACHLCMSVSTGPVQASANTIAGALRGEFFRESTIGELDDAAAVRRAIVRAAAELARAGAQKG